ncbi:MAG: hypothetical protein PVH29_14265 [Candidatus Zixiibacteriota bacterium]
MKVSRVLICITSAFILIFAFGACGKKAEEPATAETAETPAEAPPAETPAEDVAGAFGAKAVEVDEYMKAHDVTNTPAEEIAATLSGFKTNFEELGGKAEGDEALATRCNLAAEAMGLYVDSLQGDPLDSVNLAIDAEAKWSQAKEGMGEEEPPM